MTTFILLCVLIMVTIWTAMTYLEKKTIDKYEETFEIFCWMLINICLFYFNIPIWLCTAILIPCCLRLIYEMYHPAKSVISLSFFIFSENCFVWLSPYTLSKAFSITEDKAYEIMFLTISIILLGVMGIILLRNKIQKIKSEHENDN